MHLVGEIDAEKRGPRDAAAQALVAAGQRHPQDDHAVHQHLKGEREEGKIYFLEAHADRADHEPQGRAHCQRKDEGGRNRHAGALHEQRERVGAEPVEHAVAERDHAAVADQKIQRGREQGERRAADHEIDQRLARKDERQQGQHGERGGADRDVEGE